MIKYIMVFKTCSNSVYSLKCVQDFDLCFSCCSVYIWMKSVRFIVKQLLAFPFVNHYYNRTHLIISTKN